MTKVRNEAIEALVKALSNVDETIELDLIDATAVAFELQLHGFTVARHPAMTEAELEREMEIRNLQTYKLFPESDELLVKLEDILTLTKKYRG